MCVCVCMNKRRYYYYCHFEHPIFLLFNLIPSIALGTWAKVQCIHIRHTHIYSSAQRHQDFIFVLNIPRI